MLKDPEACFSRMVELYADTGPSFESHNLLGCTDKQTLFQKTLGFLRGSGCSDMTTLVCHWTPNIPDEAQTFRYESFPIKV